MNTFLVNSLGLIGDSKDLNKNMDRVYSYYLNIVIVCLSWVVCSVSLINAQDIQGSLVIQDGHKSKIVAMASHPFYNQLATIDQTGELIVWDMLSQMILDKHYLGARGGNAKKMNYSSSGNNLYISTYENTLSDKMANSDAELFNYNLKE